jgi:hypothetical protein
MVLESVWEAEAAAPIRYTGAGGAG